MEFYNFISVMLSKKPEKRPTAKEAFSLFSEEMKMKKKQFKLTMKELSLVRLQHQEIE